ncbi:ABC transporter permease [Changpingibacter yushuensis]|uniref:ABC transporter permease n=1 Tax=Changpingibacter yushuensis TaxID=2758440 RepID=UPI001C7129E7|nr:ABC transporter permease [Changpingibacter yushuensis]
MSILQDTSAISDQEIGVADTEGALQTDRQPQDSRVGGIRRSEALVKFLAARLFQAVLVVWSAVTLTFIAVHAAPGNIVDNLLTDAERSNVELRARVIQEWGLDRPVFIQYLGYLGKLVRGDLGTSYVQHKSVNAIFAEQFPYTIQLTITAMIIATAVALLGSLLISNTTHPLIRGLYEGTELTLLSTPPFWFGILLLAVFSFQLGWFPVAGASGLAALVLPALAIGIPEGGNLSQILRQGIGRGLDQPFVTTARSRGLSGGQIKRRHLLRHASIPAVTVGTMMIGNLLGGAVITEQVFGRPGLGQIAVNAITSKDLPVILAVAFVSSLVFVIASTVVDLLYFAIDPRIRGALGRKAS